MQKLILLSIKLRYFLIILFVIIPFIGLSNNNQKNILYVSSFGEDTYWSQKTEKALIKTFEQENYNVNLINLYLDEETYPKYEDRLNILKKFFINNKEDIDVILVFDYSATSIFLNYTDSIISKIPIVFVSEFEKGTEIKYRNMTGIISDYGVTQTYKLGLKMFSKTQKVYIWADESPTGRFFIENAKRNLKGYNPDIEIEYGLNVGNLEELRKKCRSVEPNSFIIFSTWSLDTKGRKYSDKELSEIFFKEVKVPMFCTYDESIGEGFIGGYVQTPEPNAIAAARKAIRIFNGEFVYRMYTEHISPTLILDLKGIVKYEGHIRTIPSNAVLVNKLQGQFLKFQGFLIPIIVLLLLSGFLLYNFISQNWKNAKLRKTIKEKEEKEKSLEENVRILSSAMPSFRILAWVYNQRTKSFKYGVTDENGILEINKESDLDYAMSFVRKDFEEGFKSFFGRLDEITDMKEFHLEYIGRIPGEMKDSWWEIKGKITEMEDEDGRYKILNAIHININRFKQIENRLNEALTKAIRSDKLKSNFISNITHEIRTPLNAIIGFASLINNDLDDESRQQFTGIIKQNSDSLIKLINDILLISEIQSGYFEFKPITLDLSQHISEIESIFRYRFPKEIEFIVDNPYKSCIVEVDKDRLFQMAKIFIENALKFTYSGYVKMGYYQEGNGITYYCEDTGIGIKEEDIDSVYSLFEKANSMKEGTGLGLGIVKTMIERLDGKYGVESIYGKGSRFWVWIPSRQILIDHENESETNIEIDNIQRIKPKILIVDSESYTFNLLEKNNYSENYNIVVTPNDSEVLSYIHNEKPDIILLAESNQYLDDYEVLKRIRLEFPNLPIIIISEKVLFHEKPKAFKAGCNDFFEKPIDIDLLQNKIKKLTE